MNGDEALDFVGAASVVAFLAYALLQRRLPARVWQVMIPLWTSIIGAVWIAVDLFLRWRQP